MKITKKDIKSAYNNINSPLEKYIKIGKELKTPPKRETYTPGPWVVDYPSANVKIGNQYFLQYRGFVNDPFGVTVYNAHANADLIACAPELLETLKTYIEKDSCKCDYCEVPHNDCSYCLAKKLISRAEGREV